MSELTMATRSVDFAAREIVGVVAPYDETSYLTGTPGGERLRRGCFGKSIAERGDRIPLLVGHDHRRAAVGKSVGWHDGADGLLATFKVRPDEDGDRVLGDARDGYLPALSVGFEPLQRRRAADGAIEVTEARVHEVSLVSVGAYSGAQVLATRAAEPVPLDVEALMAPFRNPPRVDMSPLPPIWS
jgi:uncharacterized protein